MTAYLQGSERIMKTLEAYNRRFDKERVAIVKKAARETLVGPIKAEAMRSPGRAGPRLAKATNVRSGRDKGQVLVGPREGKSREDKAGAWFRAIFIVGHPRAYPIPRAERAVKFLSNAKVGFRSGARVTHPAIPSNPFVQTGGDRGRPAFVAAVSKALFSKENA